MALDIIVDHLRGSRDQALQLLRDLVRIPSVSTGDVDTEQIDAALGLVARELESMGFSHRIFLDRAVCATQPLLVATHLEAGPNKPTLLYYGHVDVQPAGDGWVIGQPFDLSEVDGLLYGRGTGDDKGQVVAFLSALRAFSQHGALPVNLVVLIETGEEAGSKTIQHYLSSPALSPELDAVTDVLICDTTMVPGDAPTITLGLRGHLYFHVRVTGAERTLHSGLYGGVVRSASTAMTQLLASLEDVRLGLCTIPGFYDGVEPLDDVSRQAVERFPLDLAAAGISRPIVRDHSARVMLAGHPSMEICGISSGDIVPGGESSILPHVAEAKLAFRLVPGQDPDAIERELRAALERFAANDLDGTVQVELRRGKCGLPFRMNPADPAVLRAARVLSDVWGAAPALDLGGGTIPVISAFAARLPHAATVLLGMTDCNSGFHGPDEHLARRHFELAAETDLRYLAELAGA